MATYKTPGAFIEEIPKFPPSVAQVETAIPAFIGYTQFADDIAPNDLLGKPKRIGSLVEFSHYYGEGPPLTVSNVIIDDANNFKSAGVDSQFYMYDSLRLFFANGGGDCYIVSVGNYADTVDATALNGGIDDLMKEDVPTLLVFPDAVTLTGNGLYTVQQHALQHCADLARMDRFCIFDLKRTDPLGTEFRSGVGINDLSYGAAYTPWLNTNLPKKVTLGDVATNVWRNGSNVTLQSLTTDTDLQAMIVDATTAVADRDLIAEKTKLLTPGSSMQARFTALAGDVAEDKDAASLEAVMAFLMSIVKRLDDFLEPSNPLEVSGAQLAGDLQSAVDNTFKNIVKQIIVLDKTFKAEWGTDYTSQATVNSTNFTTAVWDWASVPPGDLAADALLIPGADEAEKVLAGMGHLAPIFENLARAYQKSVVDASATLAATLDDGLAASFPLYKNILRGVSNAVASVPPSGAVAGIYAMVDSTRGVWKAPANVSVSNVVEPAEVFTKSQLDELNVDVNAGKSINAIRSFFGKGTLVYGARTLAGNNNEWRYISTRRLFIMVEESIKKASEQFVFEPNDANTWVKVQAMIENFLFNLWRQGALQGAKPEHAFYVAVGLGKTMNPVDILEGRMIVEIGMAAVRPAEFIILRFSHKMAES